MSKRVLVGEDDADVSAFLEKILTDAGYTVTCVDNGLDLLRKAAVTADFDLIVTDINMPRGRGDSMVAVMKEKNIDIPTILITGINNPHPPYGVPVLEKPFVKDELLALIDVVVAGDGE